MRKKREEEEINVVQLRALNRECEVEQAKLASHPKSMALCRGEIFITQRANIEIDSAQGIKDGSS